MIPMRDDNPVRGIPVVTILTILACMAVYLWQISLPPQSKQAAITLLGFMPGVLFGYASIEGDPWVSPTGSIFTAMFLHGGFFHLAGNMLYLWIFGDNVEDRMGRGRFVAFYLICGAIAALAQALPDMRSTVPMIGASGAVSGVLGAYLVLYPRANVLVAMPFLVARVPALIVLGLWFAGQLAQLAAPRARCRRRRIHGARRRLHRRRGADSLVSARATKSASSDHSPTLRMLQAPAAPAIMRAFSEPRGRMASEPLDLSSGPSAPQDGAAVIPIVAPTVVAFIGRTERGPLNEPVRIKGFDEFTRIFGGPTTFSFVSLAVQHFFSHGGEAAVVVRVANRATRAMLEIPAGREILRLQARQPGSREHLRVSVDYDRVERAPDKFNLVVQRVPRAGSQLVDDQEVFDGLSMDPTDERFIVDALQESELVRLVGPLPSYRPAATRAPHPGQPIPYIAVRHAGSDGEELTDYDIIGSNAEGTGLFALDRCERVDLVCVPSPPGRDLGSTSFLAATRYCERRRALLVWDPPWAWESADSAVLGLRVSAARAATR